MHRQEPAAQRQLRSLEDRAAGQTALMPMSGALPVAPARANEAAVPGALTTRAVPPRGPARGKQRRLALLLATIALEELGHRQSRLKLHSIHRHGTPPSRCADLHPLGGSSRAPAEECR